MVSRIENEKSTAAEGSKALPTGREVIWDILTDQRILLANDSVVPSLKQNVMSGVQLDEKRSSSTNVRVKCLFHSKKGEINLPGP